MGDTSGNIIEQAPVVPDGTGNEAPPPITPGAPPQPDVEAAAAPDPAAYTPNLKFSYSDPTGKKNEVEFDEWIRPHIKSKEVEEKVRDLYSKAFGLDTIKSKNETLREEFTGLHGEYTGIRQGIDELKTHVANRDFDQFFQRLNIPNEMIYDWVRSKIAYENLPQDQKRIYDEAISSRRRASDLERDQGNYQALYQDQLSRSKQLEVDMEISKPGISQLVQEYDNARGRTGAFLDQLVIHAYSQEQLTGRQVSAAEAVQSLLGLMGKTPGVNPGNGAPAPQAPQVLQPSQVPSNQKPIPVIPNIRARGSSPVKKVPQNLRELQKNIDEILASKRA